MVGDVVEVGAVGTVFSADDEVVGHRLVNPKS